MMRWSARVLVAATVVSVGALGVALAPIGPAQAATSVSGVAFEWGINTESTGGAYAGGCNFLSAGVAGDTGSARVWTEGDGFWSASDGGVTIAKPDASGAMVAPTWATKCRDRSGATVTTATASTTESVVRIADGTGTVDPDADSASIAWSGGFTVAYYGGMTYWSAENPRLEVSGGSGTLTATLSGYRSSMDDLTVWEPVAPREVVVAEFDGVDVTASGIEALPNYLGQRASGEIERITGVEQPDVTAQTRDYWGAFGDDFLQFQAENGQGAYWYTTSENSIQPRKVPVPVRVDYGPGFALGATSGEPGDVVALTGRNLPDGADVSLSSAEGDVPLVSESLAGGDFAASFAVPADWGAGVHELTATATAGGEVVASDALSFTVVAAPGAVRSARVTGASASAIELRWKAPAGGGADRYRVTADRGEGRVRTETITDTRATLGGLKADTEYAIEIVARNAAGDSDAVALTGSTTAKDGTGGGGLTGDGEVDGAVLRWGLNSESGGAAFAGVCNFLSAGVAGDTGGSVVWGQSMYRAESGAVRIEKPDASGTYRLASWSSRCLDRDGEQVTLNPVTSTTESQVVMTGGEGVVADDGAVEVRWTGGFTVAYYGGMTYWSAADPVLRLDASGSGTLTATLSGYGTDMNDQSKWVPIRGRSVVLATVTGVDAAAAVERGRFTATPSYLGVRVTASGVPQAKRTDANAGFWGSFPQGFVDFQQLTGQAAYWYTSNGQRDAAKPVSPLTVQFDASESPEVAAPPAAPPTTGAGGTVDETPGGTTPTSTPTPTSPPVAATGGVDDDGQAPATTAVRDTALTVAAGSGAVAAALGANLAGAWLIRRRLGLDPGHPL